MRKWRKTRKNGTGERGKFLMNLLDENELRWNGDARIAISI